MIDRLVALSSAKLSSNSNRPEDEEEEEEKIQEKKKLQEFYSYPLEYQVTHVTRKDSPQ